YSCANALRAYGVTTNAISPGAATRMTDSVPTERRRTRVSADEWSPDNVAPIVAYLAGEQSGWINGRIVHSSGYEIALYSNPEPEIRIIGTGPCDAASLASRVEPPFGPKLGGNGWWRGRQCRCRHRIPSRSGTAARRVSCESSGAWTAASRTSTRARYALPAGRPGWNGSRRAGMRP